MSPTMLALAERVITVRWSIIPVNAADTPTMAGIKSHMHTFTGITRKGRFKSRLLAASMISGPGFLPFLSWFRQTEMGLSIRLDPVITAK